MSDLSKFDPQPKASQEHPQSKPTAPVAKAEQPKEIKQKQDIPPKHIAKKKRKTGLELGSGYTINLKPDSGYRVFLRIMARESHFTEAIKNLEDTSSMDKPMAQALLKLMLVRNEAVVEALRADAEWQEHCLTKIRQLQERASKGDEKAKRTLANAKRVQDGSWVGDVKEIISTCCGAWENSNRNVEKFDDSGVTFRKFPLRPSRDEPVYLMMFPAKFVDKVISALRMVYGIGKGDKAEEEKVPEKLKMKNKV